MDIMAVRAKIQTGNEYCKRLASIGKIKYTDFAADGFKVAASERYYDVIAEVICDIAYYICVVKQFGIPHSATEALNKLVENNLIHKAIRDDSVLLYNFRNKIAHVYQEITSKQLYEGVNKACSTYDKFIGMVLQYI